MAKLRIRYFKWRDGRPRWEPGPALRRLGFAGVDLKNAAGLWLSEGDAIVRAQELNAEADARRLNTEAPKRGVSRSPHSCEDLWDRYRKSSKFTGLAAATQYDYEAKAQPFLYGFKATRRQVLGNGRTIEPGEHVDGFAGYIVAAIDKPVMFSYAEILAFQKGKSMSLGIIAVARRLFSFAELIGWRSENSNPAFRLELARPAPRLRLGTPTEIAAVVAAADLFPVMDRHGKQRGLLHSMGDAIVLALHSGQRQRDVLAMPDTIVDAERIKLSQFKTGAAVDVKMTPACAARMTAAKQRARSRQIVSLDAGPIIVHEGTGQAYNAHTFRHLFAEVRTLAATGQLDGKPVEGLKPCASVADLQFLDLRDTAVTRLALAGCSKWQIASITGHSFESIDRILKHYLVLSRDFADPAIDMLVEWMAKEGIAI